ncbi:MAG: serine/threonine-protein kinase, partial [Planctomycetota bacterium]
KDSVLARLAVERGYLTQEQLDEALETQRKAREELGMDQPLVQVLLGKRLLSADQAQELRNATAMETGEARLVAGYEVVSKLGQGGMGAVYRAKSRQTGQFVALKILPPSLATDDLVRRFEREAEVVSKLDHKHIVGCVEFGFDPRRKVHFCALELIEGEDLEKRIARLGVLSEEEATRITYQVSQALQHAFFNGLVHRDIKPPNIMVTKDGTAKLLDLGLARSANMEVTRLTQTGAFVGSPYYASPEQATGESDIDIRSDIYSLGCTLYHMVTGKPPFGGTTVIQVLQKHLTEQMPWPQEANPPSPTASARSSRR